MLNEYSKFFFILEILYMQKILSYPLESDSSSTYDQRQTGKYNIHISLKDVAIIEVDKNEFIDDTDSNAADYYYDEEDLTIKPISNWSISTTKKTTPIFNTTSKGLIDVHLLPNKQEIAIAIDANTDVLRVMEPVLHNNKKTTQANIPQLQTAQRNIDHTGVTLTVHNAKKIGKGNQFSSSIPNIISGQSQFSICKNNGANVSGNCRKKMRSPILKSLFDILKLIRLKDI